jgi:hypothetical protein
LFTHVGARVDSLTTNDVPQSRRQPPDFCCCSKQPREHGHAATIAAGEWITASAKAILDIDLLDILDQRNRDYCIV